MELNFYRGENLDGEWWRCLVYFGEDVCSLSSPSDSSCLLLFQSSSDSLFCSLSMFNFLLVVILFGCSLFRTKKNKTYFKQPKSMSHSLNQLTPLEN